MSGNEQVLVEIQTFLQALASYPDRFAVNPRMTFDQYRSSLAASVHVGHVDPHSDARKN